MAQDNIEFFCKTNGIQYKSIDVTGKVPKITFISTECGHVKTSFWTNVRKLQGVKLCSTCNRYAKLPYDTLVNLFDINNCTVLTSKDEYKNIDTRKDKIKYVSQCGHLCSIVLSHFKNDGQGRQCKLCTYRQISEKSFQKHAKDNMYCQRIEAQGIDILTDILKESFTIKRTYEGCLADVYIKPSKTSEDLWLPIQIKATVCKDSKNRYMFGTKYSDYSELVVCCICINGRRFWVFDNKQQPAVNIGISKTNARSKSKYDKYEVSENSLIEKMNDLYQSQKLMYEEIVLTPSSKSVCKEIKYRKIREDNMPYLAFEYPNIQCQVYDFIINGFKVQEKVLIVDNKRKGLTANLKKTIRKGKKGPYERNDNDFYWFHVQDSSKFYIIPQQSLIDNGYIRSSTSTGNTKILLYPQCTLQEAISFGYKTSEYNNFLYSYDDVEKVKNIFKI